MRKDLVVLGLWMLWLAPGFAQEIVFRFAYEDKDIPPYIVGEGISVPVRPGVLPEAVRALETKIPGLKVQLKRMPWKRCLAELGEGAVDGVVGSFQPERMRLGAYPMKDGQPDSSLRLNSTRHFFYKLKTSTVEWDGTTLHHFSGAVGAQFGYSVVDDLQKAGIPMLTSSSAFINFQNLAQARVALVAAHEDTGKDLLKRPEFSGMVAMEPPFSSKDYYLILSHQFLRRHPELAARLWHNISVIREKDIPALTLRYKH